MQSEGRQRNWGLTQPLAAIILCIILLYLLYVLYLDQKVSDKDEMLLIAPLIAIIIVAGCILCIGALYTQRGAQMFFFTNLPVPRSNRVAGRAEVRRPPFSSFHYQLMLRDFTGADYDLLQQLDEGINNRLGAQEGDLRRLPVYAIKAQDLTNSRHEAKSCSICLEPFCVNDAIKILPCLHQYHESCVDKWLRTRAECPVCKFSILDIAA